MNSSDVTEITLMSPGDILFLYTDGVYDGSDEQDRHQIEGVIREHKNEPAKEICNAILAYAESRMETCARLESRIRSTAYKTAFVVKHG